MEPNKYAGQPAGYGELTEGITSGNRYRSGIVSMD